MNPILKNVLAVVAGIVVGSIVNMGLIMLSSSVIPLPEGADPTSMEALNNSMHLMQPKHFIFPFLAHALGTLAGAFTAFKLAANNHMKFAIGIGVWFLLGGIANSMMLSGSPLWFKILDLAGAYFPMAWLGGTLASNQNRV